MPKVRIVAISDTHGQHEGVNVPDGDIFIHAGDFMVTGKKLREIGQFDTWLRKLPHRWKLVVPGNHDLILEGNSLNQYLLTNAVYLDRRRTEICGLRFWGCAITPYHNGWAFMMPRRGAELGSLWASIPDHTDVLITHGPAWGILDLFEGTHCGCEMLLEELAKRSIPHHIFGHIHPDYGYANLDGKHYYNVAILDEDNNPTHAPTVIDIEVDPNNPEVRKLKDKEWR